MADLLSANLPFELFWGHPNEVPLAIIFLFFQETTSKTTVVMNQQPHTSATPEQDLMITQEMVINKVMNTWMASNRGEVGGNHKGLSERREKSQGAGTEELEPDGDVHDKHGQPDSDTTACSRLSRTNTQATTFRQAHSPMSGTAHGETRHEGQAPV